MLSRLRWPAPLRLASGPCFVPYPLLLDLCLVPHHGAAQRPHVIHAIVLLLRSEDDECHHVALVFFERCHCDHPLLCESASPRSEVPHILDPFEQLIRMEGARLGVNVTHKIVILNYVVGLRNVHGFAERQADVREYHVVCSSQVEQVRQCNEATSVNLGNARHATGILLEVNIERTRDLPVQGADGVDAYFDDAWLEDSLRERRDGRGTTRLAAAAEVGDTLTRLDQHEFAVLPEALAGKVPTRQVLR